MFLKKKTLFRLAALMLIVVLCLGLSAPIAQARASNYIAAYGAYMNADGSGKVSVWYDVTGTGMMEEIGSTSIVIYENGSIVKTFYSSSTPSMMTKNKAIHGGSVSYNGVAGRSYYAIVYVWAAKLGDGDTRSKTTASIIAK